MSLKNIEDNKLIEELNQFRNFLRNILREKDRIAISLKIED